MQPRLSVVVSVHNAAQHLTECLESLAGQTLSCFEAVLVDDGCTDDSPRIAADFAARDPRFRVVRQEHAGPSAARNRGVHETPRTVEFLAFADGTDVLAHDAYARLTASLDTTGSAFALGNIWRLGGHGRHQEPSYRWLTDSRARTHITRDARLLADHSVPNKVFRRAFWDRHGLSFPEGRQYAAGRVTLPAHFLAGSVDLLRAHVCYQRARQAAGAEEATDAARHADAKAVRDRIAACEHISRFLSVQQPAHRAAYDLRCLATELVPFLEALPAAGAGYREAFLAAAPDFVATVTPGTWDELPAGLRVRWHLVRERRLPELIDLLASGPGDDSAFQVHGRFLRYAAFPVVDTGEGSGRGPGWTGERGGARGGSRDGSLNGSRDDRPQRAPRPPLSAAEPPTGALTLTRLDRGELPAVARAREITFDASGRLVVKGYAYVRNLAADRPGHALKTGVLLAPRHAGGPGARHGGHRMPGMPGGRGVPGVRGLRGMPRVRRVPTRTVADPAVTAESGQRLHCYDHAGFEMTVDLAKLRSGGRWRPAEWALGVLVAGHGTVRYAPVCALEDAAAQSLVRDLDEQGADAGRWRLEVHWAAHGGQRWEDGHGGGSGHGPWARADGRHRLMLRVVECTARIEGHRRDGDDVVFSGRVYGSPGAGGLRTGRGGAGTGTGDAGAGTAAADGSGAARGTASADPADPGVPLALRLSRPDPEDDAGAGTGTVPGTASGPGTGRGTGLVIEAPLVPEGDRFTLRVPLAPLAAVPPAVHRAPREVPPPYTEPWRADLVMADGSLTAPPAVSGLPPGRYPLGDGRELCATADDRGILRIELTRRPIADTVCWGADGSLTISGTGAGAGGPGSGAGAVAGGARGAGGAGAELVLRHAGLDEEVTVPLAWGGGEVRRSGDRGATEADANVPTDPDAPADPNAPAKTAADAPAGTDVPAKTAADPDTDPPADTDVPAKPGPGPLRFSATFTPGGGTLGEGRWYAYVRHETGIAPAAATTPATDTHPTPAADADPGTTTDPTDTDATPTPTPAQAHAHAHPSTPTEIPLRVLAPLGAELPAHRACQGRDITVRRLRGDLLVIDTGSVLDPAERGPYRRHRLRTTHYAQQREQPLREAILYTAGRGDDSPRAVHEELVRRGVDIEHLWVSRDQQTRVPPAARAIEEHGAGWYEALARCRRIVASDHLPEFFERRPDQTVVQTWHGVPLKRIGADLTGTRYADHAHLDALPWLAAQWSVLVSPNRFAISHLCRALGYDGELLQAGSPRNDILFSADRDKIAEQVREQLGIEPGRRVVLYAPTYRDHYGAPGAVAAGASGDARRHAYEPAFDFPAAERALGADHVLLVRKHPLTIGRLPGAHAPFVRDVTHHPHAAELLLIADVLVTDYSSLMFDFAHTGRPMLFHAYDLEHYRDTARGFTLDFETRAPGPLLTSTEEVVAALHDLDAIAERHADAYAAFRDAYCDLDDGQAAARVADRLMREP